MIEEFCKLFEDLRIEDVPSVGGKNASLGEMIRNLNEKGVSVPSGFAVTAYAYKYMIEKAGIDVKIKEILSDLNTHDVNNLAERGKKIRELIKNTPIPPELDREIRQHYRNLESKYDRNVDVAVRSSATAEDLPDSVRHFTVISGRGRIYYGNTALLTDTDPAGYQGHRETGAGCSMGRDDAVASAALPEPYA